MTTSRSRKAQKKFFRHPLSYYIRCGTKSNRETDEALEQLSGGPLTLARVLYSIRMCEDWTQVAFARKLGISRQLLNDIEKGRRSVSIERAAKFAGALNHPEIVFVKLVLQSLVDEAGLDMVVKIAEGVSAKS